MRCAARIAALQPSVVLVRGSTARAVQDSLRARGVALALGVRDRALKRAARATKADLVASIDARIGTPRLGTCEQFYVNSCKYLGGFGVLSDTFMSCILIATTNN